MLIRLLTTAALLGLAALVFSRLVTAFHAASRLTTPEEAQPTQYAIVFGAGLRRDGAPTAVLRDRVATAAELYQAGKVEKLLMSGHASEPAAMRDYALLLGVPAEAVVLDESGLRTYDTCYRARATYGLTEAILVTQRFHLPRALYICNALSVSAQGVPADQHTYQRRAMAFWNVRESFATLVALWEVHVSRPVPLISQPGPVTRLEEES